MHKETEDEKNTLHEQFVQAQKMEAAGRLAGRTVHDFNNILTTIMGLSDIILLRPELMDIVREDVTEIRNAAGRAACLTQQFLAFSRKQDTKPKKKTTRF